MLNKNKTMNGRTEEKGRWKRLVEMLRNVKEREGCGGVMNEGKEYANDD